MISTRQSSGKGPFRLRDLKNGRFEIHAQNGPAFEGTWFAIFTIAQDLGCEGSELEVAKSELARLEHDYASFGVMGTFLFTAPDKRNAA